MMQYRNQCKTKSKLKPKIISLLTARLCKHACLTNMFGWVNIYAGPAPVIVPRDCRGIEIH